MTVEIEVDTEDALVDDVIKIAVTGLHKRQQITVRAEVIEKGQVFAGSGCFVADDNGIVELSSHPSLCGTYTGVSPMGLFWSMRSSPNMPQGIRLMKRNVSFPLLTELSAFPSFLSFEETYTKRMKPLIKKKIRRWYMAKDVQKIPVKSGRLRGALFLPPGRGPFPGVIDIAGIGSGSYEYRAALLASRGFATLALPFFLYDDLPKRLADVELEYFMEAIGWISSHRHVNGSKLGVIGGSKGGEIALQMGYYSDKIKSVISINGAPFLTMVPMLYKGQVIGKSKFDPDNHTVTEEGIAAENSFDCEIENYLPIWEKDVHVLLIGGGDDRALKPKFLPNLYNCYPADRRHLCELHVYPDAGHLIDPPYSPLARSTIRYNTGITKESGTMRSLWGGETVGHAIAQEDSWKHILNHFRRTLSVSQANKVQMSCKL